MAQRRNLAPVPAEKSQQPPIVAAARRVDIEGKEVDGYRRKAKSEAWQREGWVYFDLLGEVKQPTYYIANACSLARLYVATQPDPEQDPSAPAPGTPGLFEAEDALERLRSGAKGGMGGLTRSFVVNAKIAGECYLVGIPEQPEILPGREDPTTHKVYPEGRNAIPETWGIYSVSQIDSKGDGRGMYYTYKDRPDAADGTRFAPGADVIRMWQEHPEFPDLSDCAMRALLSLCEELLILSRMVKAVGRSRLATAGLLAIATELDITTASQPGTEGDGSGQDEKAFVEKLMEAAEQNILNEGIASAAVPIVIRGPHDMIKDGIVHIPLDRKLDPLALEQRKEIIQRMGQGSDVPMEILVGLRNLSHWTSFLVDQSLWDRYGHPTMLLWAESLTVGYLRPMMEEAGLAPEVAANFMVWFDPGGAVVQPDRTETVMQSLDRLLISWEAARTILSFSDSDAPSDEEIRQRIDIAVAMKGQAGGGSEGEDAVGPSGHAAPGNGKPSSPQTPPEASNDFVVALKHYVDTHNGKLPLALAAAAKSRRQPLGKRLMAIDNGLRTRLTEAADAAVLRALERAGARVRNRAKANSRLGPKLRTLAASEVPANAGRATVASLGYTDDELLADGFDDLGPKFASRVAKAQGEALDILAAELDLDAGEIASLEATQERQRNEAWDWLAAALVSLSLSLLYNPSPEAPARGEFDSDVRVPAGMIREALARAGGAPGVTSADGAPAGGVALGQLVLETFARHGQVTTGWVWDYGDPSSRTTSFDPHIDLDGAEFATWTDDALVWQSGDEWLDGNGFYKPGDHRGCQCNFWAQGLGADEQADAELVGAET